MDEETEERDNKEGFLASNFGIVRQGRTEKTSRFFNDCVDFASDGQDSGSPKSKLNINTTENDVNHLNALANLDPGSKFGENAALIKDIRLAASAAAEDEMNKVYMCHLCDFKTAYANSLMNHQAVHSDFRPWACTACDYAAKRKQDLKKHLHTVHGMMVESPMLKPVGLSPSGIKLGCPDGADSVSMKRSSSDQECSILQPASSTKRLKDEAFNLSVAPHSSIPRSFDQQSELPGGELDSPDDNLPISFPISSSTSVKHTNTTHLQAENPSLPKFLPGREEGEIVFNSAHPNFSWHVDRRDKLLESSSSNISREWPNPVIKQENSPTQSMFVSKETSHRPTPMNKLQTLSRRENSFHRSFSLSDDDTHTSDDRGGAAYMETDRSITSSSLMGQARSTQTPSGFLCEHCDILFFQRAMYVMHIGLHAPDNPWCCSVCGNTFSEKYSFTSHFINQH